MGSFKLGLIVVLVCLAAAIPRTKGMDMDKVSASVHASDTPAAHSDGNGGFMSWWRAASDVITGHNSNNNNNNGSSNNGTGHSEMKPLLALVMIVKDEASSLVEVLETALPFVDQWYIYDTGSTDGTQEIIRNITARHPTKPGSLEEGPFVDFSFARNKVLDMAGTNTEFTIMLDGDWYIRDPENKLRAFLDARRNATEKRRSFMIRVQDSITYPSMRILRASEHIRYVGVIHEVPDAEAFEMVDESAHLYWEATEENAAMSYSRWHRDLVLLQSEYDSPNKTARTVFYLAQTLMCIDRIAEGHAMYLERAAMADTWEQERYVSYLRAAKTYTDVNKTWAEAMEMLIKAHELVPFRAEAMAAIAQHYMDERSYALAGHFTLIAASIPRPYIRTTLFHQHTVYEDTIPYLASVSYWYIGEYKMGLQFAQQVANKYPTRQNLDTLWHYVNKLGKRIPPNVQQAHEEFTKQ